MKRKYFSALLMGALTIASVSTFTSCKDYDDDIDNLQNQIKDLASADQLQQKVTELQGLITTNSTNIKDVQEAVKKAQAAAETAQTTAAQKATLEDLKKLLAEGDYASKEYVNKADGIIEAALKALETGKVDPLVEAVKEAQAAADAAKTTADKAIEEAGNTGAALEKAQAAATAAQEAKDALAKLQNSIGGGYSETTTVKDAITSIDVLLKADNTGLDALNTRLKVIEDALKSGDDTTGLATRLNNIESALKNIIGQFSTMVTDVQLFNIAQPNYTGFNRTLNFVQAAEQANVFPAEANVADKQLKFEKGKYYAGEDSLLIRVSPVDAELTPGSISLLNSQGKELDDIIDVKEVHRYKELLYGNTRAGGVNSGLWVVKFKAKDLGDNFKAAAETEVYGQPRSILYAVAVKNTYNTTDKAEEASTRRVTSEYGIDLNTTPAEPAWDFTVNERPVSWIHNRYVQTESIERTDLTTGYHAKTYAQELTWLDNNKPATKVILTGDDQNAKDRTGHTTDSWDNGVDNRQGYAILAVEKGQPITIDFGNTEMKGIKGFYVTLDEKFAQESAPSELNAWNSYTFENVGYKNQPAKLFEGSKGTITIKDMNNVKGDVIGFRVHAVNYDGTLTDPDGRSFYVAVGDVKTTKNLGNSDLTWNETNNKFESTVVLPADFSSYDFDGYYTWRIAGADESGNTPNWNDFTVKYYAEDGSEVPSLNNTVKSVKFILNNPMEFIDGATYNVTTTLTKSISTATAKVCTINASFTKKMPTDAPTFNYRDGFTKNPEYIIPAGGDYSVWASNKGGTFDLRNILIINNNTTWNGVDLFDEANAGVFTFNVAGGTYNNGNLDKAEATGWRYIMAVNNSGEQNLVDNTTERTIKANYNYFNISKRKENGSWIIGNYPVPSTSSEKIVYCSWMKTFELDVNKTGMKWSDNNKVTWKATSGANTKLYFNKLAVKVKDINLLPVKTGVNGSTMDTFLASNALAVVEGKYGEIWTTSTDGKQINPYFSASIDATGITLTQNSQSVIPSGVKGGKIHFTVKDCFGNVKPIELDFQIQSNGVDPARKH